MKHELCTIFFGAESEWFAGTECMFLCLNFAGLAGAGRRCSYFIIHTPRNRGFRSVVPNWALRLHS
jgi:hypothetical protein